MKRAMVFGVTGQAGYYLSRLLLDEGVEVLGVRRRTSSSSANNADSLTGEKNFSLLNGDITDSSCVNRLIQDNAPDYIFNLAAQSFVGVSFSEPSHTTEVTYLGALNILEAMRSLPAGDMGRVRLYQASSSEMFGSACSAFDGGRQDYRSVQRDVGLFQDENTPMLPNSPYAIAKLAAHHACRLYRDSYGIFACTGINFNFESPRRGPEFVTRKITQYVARLYQDWFGCFRSMEDGERRAIECRGKLKLGNLDAKRDWSHCYDTMRGAWLAINHSSPDDFVFASGETRSVREFLEAAFAEAGISHLLPIAVEIDPALYRPCEVPYLRGDAGKARCNLKWSPSYSFADLVRRMVENDINLLT